MDFIFFWNTSTSQICTSLVNALSFIHFVAQSRKSGHIESATKSYFLRSPVSPLLSLLLVTDLVWPLTLYIIGDVAVFDLLLVDMVCHIHSTPPPIHCMCAGTLENSK